MENFDVHNLMHNRISEGYYYENQEYMGDNGLAVDFSIAIIFHANNF